LDILHLAAPCRNAPVTVTLACKNMVRYTFTIDDALLVETMERNRRHGLTRFARYGVKAICFLGMALIVGLLLWVRLYWLAALMCLFPAAMLMGPRFDYWFAKRRFRKSPFYLQKVKVSLDASGFEVATEISTAKLDWRAFTRGIRLADGFLLFTEPKTPQWLPDRALCEGEVSEAQALLRREVPGYAG
jgi:hypothetical protein